MWKIFSTNSIAVAEAIESGFNEILSRHPKLELQLYQRVRADVGEITLAITEADYQMAPEIGRLARWTDDVDGVVETPGASVPIGAWEPFVPRVQDGRDNLIS